MIIEVENLVKEYNGRKIVDNISFQVNEGEIFCLSGPNGSGKTTTIECIEGLRDITSGKVRVLGMNPQRHRKSLYGKIGIQLQESNYPDEGKVKEICKLFSSFYPNPYPYEQLLKDFNLHESINLKASELSVGQKKKLDFILALMSNPKIVFFDEITSFLDPGSRKDMWSNILGLKERGITTVLVTHHMDEIQLLSDRVCILQKGKITALDTAQNLIKNSGIQELVKFDFEGDKSLLNDLLEVKGVNHLVLKNNQAYAYGERDQVLSAVLYYLSNNNIVFSNLRNRKPNLEDVYLKLINYKGFKQDVIDYENY
ncbi:ABC transporter, ATP-binding protein [Gottschalkia purinilytica]|uniref:ABC transporter, ATP-binding protein n=1 Tax=Gottschalkia purinilytica TaxID=1503 RepID=A0A0L0WCT2_GOTPU|nr:ABC transporter ATP-binding protein [Gottschalkia purinilytica]KNF09278.1 ABC transporter, ATP-binding protein [Gottschalkia purinilytica]